jgi:hypothetical protein
MLPITPQQRRPESRVSLSYEQHRTPDTYLRIAKALTLEEDVVKGASDFEQNGLVSWINSKFSSDITNYAEQSNDMRWAGFWFLESLAQVICPLTTHLNEEVIFENWNNKFVLLREGETVLFKEGKDLLYQLNVRQVIDTATELFKGNTNDHLVYGSLLRNNPLLLKFLAERIVAGTRTTDQFFLERIDLSSLSQGTIKARDDHPQSCAELNKLSADTVEHANRYDRKSKHAEMASISPRFPTLNLSEKKHPSPALNQFLANGQLPATESGKSNLLWEAVWLLSDGSHEYMYDTEEIYPLFHTIVKSLSHLNFAEGFNQLPTETRVLKVFGRVCEFLQAHFEGNAITFCCQDMIPDRGQAESSFLDSLVVLLKRNPNLTAIGFVNFPSYKGDLLKRVVALINDCENLTSLALRDSELGLDKVTHLAKTLAPHVTSLDLCNNLGIGVGCITALLERKTLTSLNLGERNFDKTQQKGILSILQSNRLLTSFNIGKWRTPELSDQCKRHLEYNKSQFYKVQLLSYSGLIGYLPREIRLKIGTDLDRVLKWTPSSK